MLAEIWGWRLTGSEADQSKLLELEQTEKVVHIELQTVGMSDPLKRGSNLCGRI